MKRKVDKNFSCTLDGYLEAKEYLQRKGRATELSGVNGMELVERANKLVRAEQSSASIFRSFKSYGILAIRSLRRKMTYRLHAIGAILGFCLS